MTRQEARRGRTAWAKVSGSVSAKTSIWLAGPGRVQSEKAADLGVQRLDDDAGLR